MSINRIIQLDPLLSNQIAAGEVVERPASVVKELIENSLDAKATKIEIEIEGGGVHLIRIRDNGHGIEKEDLVLAFNRHATSKIRTPEDLERINSFGFRGEALASIASVAKCRLISKSKGSSDAWQITLKSDLKTLIEPGVHYEGTTIEIVDLFYNTPVRRRFLRSEKAENLALEEMIKRLALSAPQTTFIVTQNQKKRSYLGAFDRQSIHARIGKICGQSFIESAEIIECQAGGLSLHGWIGDPSLCKRTPECQYFFVNNRMVKDRILNHAIKQLYQEHPKYSEGTYPSYVLFLDLDPSEVDVNVHPTKQEVRFSQSMMIHDFISHALRQAWFKQPDIPLRGPSQARIEKSTEKLNNDPLQEKRYILIEKNEGLYIIDLKKSKHALLSHYLESNKGNIPMRSLLFPLRVMRKNNDEIIKFLKQFGFDCKKDDQAITLFQQPTFLKAPLSEEIFKDILKKPTSLISLLTAELSHDALNAFNWETLDLDGMSAIFLTHEEIENA